jgi:hypothetical protein
MALICDKARESKSGAIDTMRTLSQIFIKDHSEKARLNAAALWYILLQNSADGFADYTCSPTFLSVIKSLIDQRGVNDPLRKRLVEIIGSAMDLRCGSGPRHPLAELWEQVKPNHLPNEVCTSYVSSCAHCLC